MVLDTISGDCAGPRPSVPVVFRANSIFEHFRSKNRLGIVFVPPKTSAAETGQMFLLQQDRSPLLSQDRCLLLSQDRSLLLGQDRCLLLRQGAALS